MMTKKLKIGFDVHGVLDSDPKFFSELSKRLIEDGHEVCILTGGERGSKLYDELEKLDISYTKLFSIYDIAQPLGVEVVEIDGELRMDEHVWDSAKGTYCDMNRIDVHFDDTYRYGEHFQNTTFVYFDKNDPSMHRIVEQHIAKIERKLKDANVENQMVLYKSNVRSSIQKSELYKLATRGIPKNTEWVMNTAVEDLVEIIFENLI